MQNCASTVEIMTADNCIFVLPAYFQESGSLLIEKT